MVLIRYLIIGVVLLVGISFAYLNSSWVNVDVYFKVYYLPLSLLLVFVLGVGVFVGFSIHRFGYFFLKRKNKNLQAQLTMLNQEISNLRILPLK